jgi:hypothetical protein
MLVSPYPQSTSGKVDKGSGVLPAVDIFPASLPSRHDDSYRISQTPVFSTRNLSGCYSHMAGLNGALREGKSHGMVDWYWCPTAVRVSERHGRVYRSEDEWILICGQLREPLQEVRRK